MIKNLYLCCLFILPVFNSIAQGFIKSTDKNISNDPLINTSYTPGDLSIYRYFINIYGGKKDLPADSLMIETASFFLETPYASATLRKKNKEHLVINLREFDCTTFVESCLAMVKTIKSGNTSFTNYCKMLQNIRYRSGNIKDYSSRLHYMVDWIYENEYTNGFVKNITLEMNGIVGTKKINYMSTHPDSYAGIKENLPMQNKIQSIENIIYRRKSYTFIPKENLAAQQNKLRNGDIVLFATNIKGLDYSHLGIVSIPVNSYPTFIHASSSRAMKVVVQKKSLVDYVNKSKSLSGVTILRVL